MSLNQVDLLLIVLIVLSAVSGYRQGFLAGIFGIIVGIIILKLLKNQEIAEIWKTLHHKIWKAKPLPVDIAEI